eukprot:scaffold21144_cov36-Phaeocystis_antarctica.AAC.1
MTWEEGRAQTQPQAVWRGVRTVVPCYADGGVSSSACVHLQLKLSWRRCACGVAHVQLCRTMQMGRAPPARSWARRGGADGPRAASGRAARPHSL